MKLTSFFIVSLLVISCRINYDEISVVDEIPEGLPAMVLRDTHYVEIVDSRVRRIVYADEFSVFQSPDKVVLRAGSIEEYDANGEIELTGRADKGTYFEDSKDSSIIGDIRLRYYPDDTEIKADRLDWLERERILSSQKGDLVEIKKGDGSSFYGTDMEIDMRVKQLTYRAPVRGSLASSTAEALSATADESAGS